MAKILVADDNSNIQKMVGLALKDQGIDVVAVGNGEAAVRKIADVRPDLVLADVFMPVRNGYEVCQFVKMDSSLSHIPVILLVGAFDPLDEQEAQRVGADGVLKKPFIPPDPLISMVKSALQRAGVSHGNSAGNSAEVEAQKAADMLTPSVSLPNATATPLHPEHPNNGNAADQSFVEEVTARPEPLRIDSAAQPVAFGSLLETPSPQTPTQETEEEESFVSQPTPELLERDWHAQDEEEVEEEEEEEPAGWRPEGVEADSNAVEEETRAAKSKKAKSNVTDWRTGGFEQIAASKARHVGWEPEEEQPELVPTAPAASNRVTEMPAAPPAVKEAAPAPANSFAKESWPNSPSAASNVPNEKTSTKTATVVEDKTPSAAPAPPAEEKKEPAPAKDSWFSIPQSPWDAEIKKATQLASTWDAPSVPSVPVVPPLSTEKPLAPVSQETKAAIEEAALPTVMAEEIREEAAQVTDEAAHAPETAVMRGASFPTKEAATKEPATTEATTPNMDDLVAKVLAKMSPEVLQAVTREILKPVVEEMVKDELKSKKS